jgi:hypothetical protein
LILKEKSIFVVSVLLYKFLSFIGFYLSACLGLSILGQLLIKHPVGSIQILTGEGGSNATSIVDGYVPIIVPPAEVSWHPVPPLSGRHSPQLTLPSKASHLDSLNFVEVNGLLVTEGEEIAFDDDPIIPNDHVLVLVQNIVSHKNENSNKSKVIYTTGSFHRY